MRLQLIAFGKLKTPGLRDTADYYSKLIRPWVKLEEVELKPLSVPDKSPATRLRIQREEEALLLKRAGEGTLLILLDERGSSWSTQEWATRAREWEGSGRGEIAVVVGSSLGFSDELRKRASGVVSLGRQTLPHELARVVLLEQLYRAWSVTRGHPYHNEG